MTSPDPFVAACPLYRNAMRVRARTGEAFEVTSRPLWADIITLGVLASAGAVLITFAAVLGG